MVIGKDVRGKTKQKEIKMDILNVLYNSFD